MEGIITEAHARQSSHKLPAAQHAGNTLEHGRGEGGV